MALSVATRLRPSSLPVTDSQAPVARALPAAFALPAVVAGLLFAGATVGVASTASAQVLAKVTGVKAVAGGRVIDVSWTAVSGADGYKVQWKSGSQEFDSTRERSVDDGATTSYRITGLRLVEYGVRVIATKTAVADGLPSATVLATPVERRLIRYTGARGFSVTEGESRNIRLSLGARPTGPVTVTVFSPDRSALIGTTSATFTPTNWNRAQPIMLRAPEDDDTDSERVRLVFFAKGGGYDGELRPALNVLVEDNDSRFVLSHTALTVTEGDSTGASYTLHMEPAPKTDTEVELVIARTEQGKVTLSGPTLTFTPANGTTPQTVTVTGVEDDDTDDETVDIRHTTIRAGYADVTVAVTVTDDDKTLAAPEGVWAEAGDGTLILKWKDPSDATITGYQYQIKKARSSWHGWKNIPNSGAATTSHTIDNLTNGTAYTVRIRAVDNGGAGAASKYVRATPGAPASSAALSARGHGLVRHLGMWRFIVQIAFSEPVTIRAAVGAKSLQVTGGTVYYARRAGSADRWELRVTRSSQAPVTITLPATTDCGASGAVCTADGRKLSAPLSLTVPLVPALRVSNARVREGPGATADFRVTMGRAAAGTVTVDYATEDGTATAGADYATTSGTLTFQAGETEKTVSVPVLDDATDEGKETFTLRLSNARGARLFDDAGTGTIKNADPLPKAWLARFGRTVGTHVTDAVGERLRGAPGQDSHVTIGGYRVPLEKQAAGQSGAGEEIRGPTLLQGVAGVLGLGQSGSAGGEPLGGGMSPPDSSDPRLGQGQSVNLDLHQILLGSSFRLALGAADADSSSPRLTAWGRFAGTTFDGQDGDLTLDGDVFTGTVGVDGAWDRLLAGVAVAHSRGDGSFTMPGTEDRGQGDLEQTLTSLHPYLRYAVTDRLDVWGLVGYGWGELDLEMADGVTYETDTTLVMGAFGSRGILLTPGDTGGFQLATRTDAMFTRTSSDAMAGLASSDGDAHRVRLVLEGSRGVTWADGRSLTPTVELGVRHDWGDAETGFGLEVGGRVQYADPRLGLTIEGAVRGLVAHEDADYEEWGAWGTVRVAPGADGRGLALTLAPAWGATASGVDGLWSRQTTAGLAPQGPRGPAAGRLTAEVGYGVAAFDAGLLTPYGGLTLAQGGTQQYRLGGRWVVEDGLTLNLEGAHQQPGGQTPADTGLLLRLEMPW